MAYGDVGGSVSSVILTCRTRPTYTEDVRKFDAVCLDPCGRYVVAQPWCEGQEIFGQAMAAAPGAGAAVPVCVRGVLIFNCTGEIRADGLTGVVARGVGGQVMQTGEKGGGLGAVIAVSADGTQCHVLV